MEHPLPSKCTFSFSLSFQCTLLAIEVKYNIKCKCKFPNVQCNFLYFYVNANYAFYAKCKFDPRCWCENNFWKTNEVPVLKTYTSSDFECKCNFQLINWFYFNLNIWMIINFYMHRHFEDQIQCKVLVFWCKNADMCLN